MTPDEVAALIHAEARPYMAHDSWCVNAASIARRALNEIGVRNYPVHVSIIHLNAVYQRFAIEGADTAAAETQEAIAAGSRMVWADAWDAQWTPNSMPGHLLTYVPEWRAYLDPSADQFNRPEKGILISPCAWPVPNDPPPGNAGVARADGGVTIIQPSGRRSFVHASGWQGIRDPAMQSRVVERIVAKLALMENPPLGGRDARTPGVH